ncbi:uncharacterized protein LOC129756167 [Uranotaenia lowii]|uniref:uncharacterized protein LOC129756167 n=1 Tax=Uranotaenia lowii TaxID=190385 RepID=UPI0024786BE3|nr:uncharacterized protein LOC129756167 [Uranotaenia lowii]
MALGAQLLEQCVGEIKWNGPEQEVPKFIGMLSWFIVCCVRSRILPTMFPGNRCHGTATSRLLHRNVAVHSFLPKTLEFVRIQLKLGSPESQLSIGLARRPVLFGSLGSNS